MSYRNMLKYPEHHAAAGKVLIEAAKIGVELYTRPVSTAAKMIEGRYEYLTRDNKAFDNAGGWR